MTRTAKSFAALLAIAGLLAFGALAQQGAPTTPQGNTPPGTARTPPPNAAATQPSPANATTTSTASQPTGGAPAPTPGVNTPAAPMPAAGSTAVPGWNNPPSWRQFETKPQYASLPGRETNVLISESGRKWRELHNGPVTFYGGIVILVIPALLLIFYLAKGQIKLHDKPTGRMIERFSSAERVAHWTMAISFVVLALSGLVMLFGKHVLLPLFGYDFFSTFTVICKNLHNFVGPLFLFSIIVSFFIFVKDNAWRAYDSEWLSSFGGLASGKEVPSGRFNAGEKVWFWGGVVVLGIVVGTSGVIQLFPNWNTTREVMGGANLVHAIFASLFIAAAFGHIYLGTIGMEGAYQAMSEGHVDETWAREHHELWYNEIKQGKGSGKVAGGTPQPATGDD